VRTPSSEQVRQPIYDRSIGHWRHYEHHLDELVTVLAPIRERYRRYESEAVRPTPSHFNRPQTPGG
jgi:hypothetical protein